MRNSPNFSEVISFDGLFSGAIADTTKDILIPRGLYRLSFIHVNTFSAPTGIITWQHYFSGGPVNNTIGGCIRNEESGAPVQNGLLTQGKGVIAFVHSLSTYNYCRDVFIPGDGIRLTITKGAVTGNWFSASLVCCRL